MRMSEKQLLDKAIVTNDGHVIGGVEELIVDTQDWHVVRVGVRLRRQALEDLGLKKSWIRTQHISMPVSEIAGISDTIVLRHNINDVDFAGGEPRGEPGGEPGGEPRGDR